MQMQWKILQPDPAKVQQIQKHLNCHPITAKVLANRNISTPPEADHFIHPSLDILPSPMNLNGMAAATQRIFEALKRNEKILVFGDYDADGVTATALLVHFLRCSGGDAIAHIPHRIDEGYGLQAKHINQLAAPQQIGLIVTVDCGSSSHEAIAAARRFGIDVIVTDHHKLESLPEALAVVNPQIPGQPPELTGLAGVGVAFYLAIGLRMVLRDNGWWENRREPKLIDLCDLVAIGTIADMVPLTGVNRVLTKTGIKQINRSPRPGIAHLCQACNVQPGMLSSDDIAFRLAPRINAAGRITHARVAFDLLNEKQSGQAQELAETLNQLNQRRQDIERQIYNSIIRHIENHDSLLARQALVLADEHWHQGVLGIVASKLVSRYHRPVVLLTIQNGVGKGSGRSIPGVNIYKALSTCEDLLEQYGGHRLAAGLTVRTENIQKLQNAFEEAVGLMLTTSNSSPCLEIDSEIKFDQIDPKLLEELKSLEPFGTDNPPPIFAAKEVLVSSAAMVGKNHRRMSLWQSSINTEPIDAIHFNLMPDTPRSDRFERLAFRLQWNKYRGRKRIQIVVEDF